MTSLARHVPPAGPMDLAESPSSSADARERAELAAQLQASLMAPPRDIQQKLQEVEDLCNIPGFAEDAMYSYQIQGKTIEGPSAPLARELATIMGHFRHGVRIISIEREWIHVAGWAIDLQNNNATMREERFRSLKPRKQKDGPTIWEPITNEVDLRKEINRRGAIAERNAILAIMSERIKYRAVSICKQQILDQANKALMDPQQKTKTIEQIRLTFAPWGVKDQHLCLRLGIKSLDDLNAKQLAELRQIAASLRDGATRPSDEFAIAPPPSEQKQRTTSAAKRLQEEASKKQKSAKPKADEEAIPQDEQGDKPDLEPTPALMESNPQWADLVKWKANQDGCTIIEAHDTLVAIVGKLPEAIDFDDIARLERNLGRR